MPRYNHLGISKYREDLIFLINKEEILSDINSVREMDISNELAVKINDIYQKTKKSNSLGHRLVNDLTIVMMYYFQRNNKSRINFVCSELYVVLSYIEDDHFVKMEKVQFTIMICTYDRLLNLCRYVDIDIKNLIYNDVKTLKYLMLKNSE